MKMRHADFTNIFEKLFFSKRMHDRPSFLVINDICRVGYGTEKGKYRFLTRKKFYEKAAKSSEQPNQVTFSRILTNGQILKRLLRPDSSLFDSSLIHTDASFWAMFGRRDVLVINTEKLQIDLSRILFKLSNYDRGLCDVCIMAILNFHAFWQIWLFRMHDMFQRSFQCCAVRTYDEYKWYLCTDRSTANHTPARMDLRLIHEHLHPSKRE
ncbi:hypothetical protein T10_12678 [Trichinella papuae]|uniref:Uncharacterized protein n=1 Tax=Trichinella papuae TaxID=268474 RepID=A0A0V1M2I5_9BILA|nr:hypothetical protein T10_12678 [Trichinella papuae]